jgi:DNA-binding NarL/FixJ family response regulator
VVDDDSTILQAVATCLSLEGYHVTTATSGTEALYRVAEAVPDLVVSDICMPGMDGFALARRLRSSPRTDLVPIVFVTAMSDLDHRVEGFRVGVDAYLTKPFEHEELIAVVESILERVRRTHAEIGRLMTAVAVAPPRPAPEIADLTEAERRVALAVARGMSNKEIASELSISVRTVENHMSRILSKKGFGNRVEVARYVLERGFE